MSFFGTIPARAFGFALLLLAGMVVAKGPEYNAPIKVVADQQGKVISIEGVGNTRTIEAKGGETIQIEGVKNHVHYKSTKNKSGQAKASTEGADNMVMKVK